jgi:predicted DNA-binding ribbon-helix-helix protein
MEENGKETTSIKIDPELWKEAKKLAIDRGITVSDLLDNLIKKELKK